MGFLRLGAACVVINDDEQVLLARRGDLGVWSLPSGRLDAGERFEDAAIREVLEETGAKIELLHPVGLYYATRWNRLNMVFMARMVGGELKQQTDETLENRFFNKDDIPQEMFHAQHVADAFDGKPVCRILETPDDEYNRLRRTFAVRWVKNLVSGNPEPRYPRFSVNAVGLMWDQQHLGVLNDGDRLPRVRCDGEAAPWEQLAARYMPDAVFEWVGLHQNPSRNQIELIFSTTVTDASTVMNLHSEEDQEEARATRIVFKESPFSPLDAHYIKASAPENANQRVWVMP